MIQFHPRPPAAEDATREKRDLFSILIPTWNNLPYLKLCIESIRKNSRHHHQIIVHINEGSDGTIEWVKKNGYAYTFSPENVGICWALNAAATLATTDFILYINDDMYACPGWDHVFLKEIEELGHDWFFLSGTMIEPTMTNNPAVISAPEFGNSIDTFREELLLEKFSSFPMEDWSGATAAPNLVSRRLWNLVGGYSIELSPGMASDPDFSMKLWQYGVRYFKGLSRSRAFHFQCKSTGRVKKNDGRRQFLRKWGIKTSTFLREYVKYGTHFTGSLPEASIPRLRQLADSVEARF